MLEEVLTVDLASQLAEGQAIGSFTLFRSGGDPGAEFEGRFAVRRFLVRSIHTER